MTPKRLDPSRLFRCTGCGGWRYYLNRPCRTCTILANRKALQRDVRQGTCG